ncbi:MAG: permease [Planctomycetota bacterium]
MLQETPAVDILFWGGIVRFAQAATAAAPTLLVGLIVAGVMRRLIGPEMTFKAFGGDTWRSLPQAWLWGMLLPVCSLGVIPIAYELRRARLSGGAILAFALTAPLFNPLSLLYGLTLSSPSVIVAFALGSLLVVTTVGFVWDRLFPGTALGGEVPPPNPPGIKRVGAVFVTAARHLVGPTLGYCAIGLAGTTVLSTVFPSGSLQDSMAHDDPTAPLLALGIAIPAYATPLTIMQQVGSMFVHGNSVGAAFVLLSLGAGANLGLLAWASRTYGLRRAAAFLGVFVTVVLAIAYSVEKPLYTAGNVESAHTHTFDGYSNPFAWKSFSGSTRLPSLALRKIVEETEVFEWFGVGAVGMLLATGLVLRSVDPAGRVDAYLAAPPPESDRVGALNREVPAPVLGGIAILGLVAISLAGCYVYYPPPEETLADLRNTRAEALSYAAGGDAATSIKFLERYDELTRKLQVGYYLRYGPLDEFQQLRAKSLRGWLERLKDQLQAGQFDRVRETSNRIFDAHRRCSQAFSTTAAAG